VWLFAFRPGNLTLPTAGGHANGTGAAPVVGLLYAPSPCQGKCAFRLLLDHPYDLDTLAFLDVNDATVRKGNHDREEFLIMTVRDTQSLATIKLSGFNTNN